MNKKVVIVIIVILLAVCGYFGYNYFSKSDAQAAAASAAPKLDELKTWSTGDPFTTNVKDSKALCRLSASIAYSGADQTEFMTTNNALIRSCILKVVRNHTEKDLLAPDAPQTLSKEMIGVLNQTLKTDVVADVYISDYVVQ